MAVSPSSTAENSASDPMSSDDVRLLAAIGFLASRHGLTDLATRIFHGLRAVRPDADFPCIGMAMSHLASGECEKALKIIAEYDDQKLMRGIELRALKSLTLHLLGKKAEAAALVATIAKDPSFSPEIYPMAGKVISLLQNEVKPKLRTTS